MAPEASGRTEDGDSTTTSAGDDVGQLGDGGTGPRGRTAAAAGAGHRTGGAAPRPPWRAADDRRASTRRRRACTSGSRSLRSATIGVARTIDEYAPAASPTNSTSARSLSVPTPSSPAPTNSSPATGSSAMTVVLIDRMRVWLTARFAASPHVMRADLSRSLTFSSTLSKTTTVS